MAQWLGQVKPMGETGLVGLIMDGDEVLLSGIIKRREEPLNLDSNKDYDRNEYSMHVDKRMGEIARDSGDDVLYCLKEITRDFKYMIFDEYKIRELLVID